MISKKSVSALFALVLVIDLMQCSHGLSSIISLFLSNALFRSLFLSDAFFTSIHSAFVLLLSISVPVFRRLRLQWSVSLPVFL